MWWSRLVKHRTAIWQAVLGGNLPHSPVVIMLTTVFWDCLYYGAIIVVGHEKTWVHYSDVMMSPTASQITSLAIVYSSVYSGADQRKHQSSASLAFVRGIHRWPVNSLHKGPVTRKIFPFDDVIIRWDYSIRLCDDLSYFDWWTQCVSKECGWGSFVLILLFTTVLCKYDYAFQMFKPANSLKF